ncbi:hypothetical protein SLEP1_g26252 [Rubroshorea leprosula]|uniref:NADH:ubiquinone reductase (H(+)-translocating) n=1 Tax=Rubroshorea leprosula TaxID=152421 RepID=A0AAV5JSJ4_9ROSI|nr:hypothetical protein SLEP1_g26252 [Rubroshorea leprosula]
MLQPWTKLAIIVLVATGKLFMANPTILVSLTNDVWVRTMMSQHTAILLAFFLGEMLAIYNSSIQVFTMAMGQKSIAMFILTISFNTQGNGYKPMNLSSWEIFVLNFGSSDSASMDG